MLGCHRENRSGSTQDRWRRAAKEAALDGQQSICEVQFGRLLTDIANARPAGQLNATEIASRVPRHREPWTEAEDRLLLSRTLSNSELARQLGRTKKSVRHRRLAKGIYNRPASRRWTENELCLLGKLPDHKVAALTGRAFQRFKPVASPFWDCPASVAGDVNGYPKKTGSWANTPMAIWPDVSIALLPRLPDGRGYRTFPRSTGKIRGIGLTPRSTCLARIPMPKLPSNWDAPRNPLSIIATSWASRSSRWIGRKSPNAADSYGRSRNASSGVAWLIPMINRGRRNRTNCLAPNQTKFWLENGDGHFMLWRADDSK